MKMISVIKKSIQNIAAILSGAMVVLVVMQVFSRYVLKTPVAQVEELARYAMIWSALLGASIGIANNSHVSVSFLVDKFPKKIQRIIHIFVHVCVVIFCLLLIVEGFGFIQKSMIQMSTTLSIKMGYIVSIVFIFGVASLIFTINNMISEFTGINKIEKNKEENK